MADPVILGTIGIDDLKTPWGNAEKVLGGSGVYAAYAASFFAKPGLVSIKGTDLDAKKIGFLKDKGIDLGGVETKGKTFRWAGEYSADFNSRTTLKTELNCLTEFDPNLPDKYRSAKYLFLGNVDPSLQRSVISQMQGPDLIFLDTMNFWIDSKRDELIETIQKANGLICNEEEARLLFDTPHLVQAGKEALRLGLQGVIIKKGEHGSMLFTKEGIASFPGYPLEDVVDPTGCGDAFGGALIGYYAKNPNMRKAILYATVIASFNAEGFGLERLRQISLEDIEKRAKEMRALSKF